MYLTTGEIAAGLIILLVLIMFAFVLVVGLAF